jgi:ATP-dependent Clp protease ATP-binding subunit ClpA
VYYLHQQGVTRLDVVNFISHGMRKDQRRKARKPRRRGRSAGDGQPKESPLDQFTKPEQGAAEGKIDPLIGRETKSSA